MKASSFWQSFWPSLLSTVLGIVLGVPAALWINSKTTEYGEKREHAQEELRLTQALETLDQALALNTKKLHQAALDFKGQQVPFEIAVDRSAWDAVKFEIIQVLHDPELQQQLAFHFARLDTLAHLNEMYLDLAIGVPSALQSAAKTRQTLRGYLESLSIELKNESSTLSAKVKSILTDHKSTQEAPVTPIVLSDRRHLMPATLGYDFILLGGCLGLIAAILLTKSYLVPSFAKEVSQTFLGQNPFLVRNQITQRVEAITGTICLGISFFLTSVGTVLAAGSDVAEGNGSYWTHLLVFIGATLVLFWGSIKFTNWRSRRDYVPQMVSLQSEIFSKCKAYLDNGGLEDHEAKRTDIGSDIRGQRLKRVTGWLDQIGKLIDVPRKTSEEDAAYLDRLSPYFGQETDAVGVQPPKA
jgi:hypothetical protein